ncbi:hypothetical protein JCM1841_001762 [Sporobolomyces salmonicolor]
MGPDGSANGAESPPPAHQPSSTSSSTASHWCVPPAPDPLLQFSYAPPVSKQSVRVSDAGGGVGESGGVIKAQGGEAAMANKESPCNRTPGGAPDTSSGQALPSPAKSGRGMDHSLVSTPNLRDTAFSPYQDQDELDDEKDEIVKVSTVPSPGSTYPRSRTGVTGRSSSSSGSGGRPDLSLFRLGSGLSPPRPVVSRPGATSTSRLPLSGQLPAQPRRSAPAMVDAISQGPAQASHPRRVPSQPASGSPRTVGNKIVPEDPSTSHPAPPSHSTSSQQQPSQRQSGPPAPARQSILTSAQQHSLPFQSRQQGVSEVNPQKRPHPPEQGPSGSTANSRESAVGAAGPTRAGVAGQRSVTSGSTAAQSGAKRRKAEPAAREEWQRYDGVIGQVSGMQQQIQVQDNEIRHLRQQLTDKANELQKVMSEKNLVKREICDRARLALSNASAANDALRTTATNLRTAIQTLKFEIGPISSVEPVRKELEIIRSDLEATFSGSSGELWLEKHEETKVSVLKEMQAEIKKRQDVISLLREQLEVKTGEVVEARDRILQLEQRIDVFESKTASLWHELQGVRTSSLAVKTKLAEQLQATLLAAAERDEARVAKVDEMEARWKERVEEAGEKQRKMLGRLEEVEEEARVGMGELRAALRAKERECEDLVKRIGVLQRELDDAFKTIDTLATDARKLKIENAELQTKEEEHAAVSFAVLVDHAAENADLTRQFEAARDEADVNLRTYKTNLANAQDELEVAKNSIAALANSLEGDKGARDAALEREKAVSHELQAHIDQLINTHRAQSEDDEKRIASLRDRVAVLQEREKSLLELEEVLRGQLRSTFAAVTELQQQQTTGQRTNQSEVAHLEDINSRYETEIERLKASADMLAKEKSAAVDAKEQLAESNASLVDENATLIASARQHESSASSALADASAQRARAQTLEGKLQTLQSAQSDIASQLEELKAQNKVHTQSEVKKAVENCKERHARDLAQTQVSLGFGANGKRTPMSMDWVQNELKRANNKLEDTTKRLQKASSELAKLKSKPVIDQLSTSSSSGSGSIIVDVPQAAKTLPAASTSDGRPNPVEQDVADSGSDRSTLTEWAVVKPATHPDKLKRSESSTGKKVPASLGEGSTSKHRSGAVHEVDEDDSENDDEGDVSAAAVAVPKTTLRPPTKTVYSTKKKRLA